MSNLPIVIQLLEVDLSQARVTFEVYDLDQTHRTVRGSLNDLNQYFQKAQAVRQIGFQRAEIWADHEKQVAALAQCDRTLAEKQTALSTMEARAKQEVEQFKTTNPAPVYDKRVSATMSSKEKHSGLLASLAVASFGVLITFTGEGALIKTLGVGCVLGGSLCAYGTYVSEVDDSSYAQRQRQLKREAEQLQGQQQTLERQAQSKMELAKQELQLAQKQRDRQQQQVKESEALATLSDLLCHLNQKLGDGILYGDETLFQALQLLSVNQQASGEAFAKGLAGAALVGLMVIGAFAGIGP